MPFYLRFIIIDPHSQSFVHLFLWCVWSFHIWNSLSIVTLYSFRQTFAQSHLLQTHTQEVYFLCTLYYHSFNLLSSSTVLPIWLQLRHMMNFKLVFQCCCLLSHKFWNRGDEIVSIMLEMQDIPQWFSNALKFHLFFKDTHA